MKRRGQWLDRQIARYRAWGFGLWAVVLKETDEMIGQCGLTVQPWKDTEVLEIGYLFERRHWHKGYATEAARACKEYAFSVLKASFVLFDYPGHQHRLPKGGPPHRHDGHRQLG